MSCFRMHLSFSGRSHFSSIFRESLSAFSQKFRYLRSNATWPGGTLNVLLPIRINSGLGCRLTSTSPHNEAINETNSSFYIYNFSHSCLRLFVFSTPPPFFLYFCRAEVHFCLISFFKNFMYERIILLFFFGSEWAF